jgi:glycosyltransferase involved in cell wall biosynthesis
MRAAYVCADSGVPVFGRKGASVHVREVVRALGRKGASVDVFALNRGEDPARDLPNARVHVFAANPCGPVAERERACLSANDDLREALDASGPFDLVYERFSLWSHAAMEWARDRAVPGILEVNAPLLEEQADHRELYDREAADRSSRRAFRAASAILAVSSPLAAYLDGFPEARGRIHVVPNGVDPARFAAASRSQGTTGPFTVGFAGSLKPWHGLPVLVEAFGLFRSRHPDARLRIVGDGPGRAALEADLTRRGLRDAADLLGSVAHEEIPGHLASMDVAVAPHVKSATYLSPLKVYEYLAAGRAIVASRTRPLEEAIREGISGLLVPPGDAVALAAALERLHADPELRRRLGEAARADAVRRHSWDAVVERILEIARVPGKAEAVA